jgi:GntR family transcriptional repressor for pyruvate dehydrogenase complex
MLESHTAYLAAGKASAADLAAAREAVRGMEASVADPPRYLEHDLRFHLTIVAATQNSVLQNLLGTTRGYLQSWIAETLGEAGEVRSLRRARTSVVEHKRILRALERRDGEAARAAMAAHVLSSSADLKRHLASRGETPTDALRDRTPGGRPRARARSRPR